jgi:branched-chain amino acid transport system substrate-binding protein
MNIALITASDTFGSSGREQLKALAASKRFTVVADEVFSPKDTDMTAQLTKIREGKPDAIICWGTYPGSAVITRNIKQLGIRIPLYMSSDVASRKYIDLAGAGSAEGVLLPAGKLAVYDKLKKNDPQLRTLKQYDHAYKKEYGVEASTFGGYAFDAFHLIIEAIKMNGATSEQIRSGVEKQHKIVGVTGVFAMSDKDHNGLDLKAFEIVRINNGDWVIAH